LHEIFGGVAAHLSCSCGWCWHKCISWCKLNQNLLRFWVWEWKWSTVRNRSRKNNIWLVYTANLL